MSLTKPPCGAGSASISRSLCSSRFCPTARTRWRVPPTEMLVVGASGSAAASTSSSAGIATKDRSPPAARWRAWRERHGLRRYGFHGLSYAWASRRARELLGRDDDVLTSLRPQLERDRAAVHARHRAAPL